MHGKSGFVQQLLLAAIHPLPSHRGSLVRNALLGHAVVGEPDSHAIPEALEVTLSILRESHLPAGIKISNPHPTSLVATTP